MNMATGEWTRRIAVPDSPTGQGGSIVHNNPRRVLTKHTVTTLESPRVSNLSRSVSVGSPKTLPSAPGLLIATPREGDTIRQYEIIRELGSGGMGAVFLARDNRLGRRVAIKFLNTNKSTDIYRFLDEAQATARCCHENIVVIYEVGEHHGTPFMVLEYLQGGTLAQFRQATPPLAPARVVEVMASVVRALACAHEQGIIHRDLKPEHIMLTDAGSVKVLDFGIAKVLKPEPSNQSPAIAGTEADGAPAPHTRRGVVLGSLLYMSPEQWEPGAAV